MSAMTTTVLNGILPPSQDVADEIAEFEKILKLRDEILAGNHPRLTVPAHVLRKVSPASSHSSVVVQNSAQQNPTLQLPGLTLTRDGPSPKPATPVIATTASGIHPALLTKSDDLVRAENTLARQRLEKQLRDQFEQKRFDFRKKPAPAEAKPDFHISALLAKALEVVKPAPLSNDQSEKEDENESFDTNSLYSSRAPDSTPERVDQDASTQEQEVRDDTANDADVSMLEPPTGPRQPFSRNRQPPVQVMKPIQNPFASSQNAGLTDADDEDEGEYSPPEADQYPALNGTISHQNADPRSRQMRRYSDLDQSGRRAASPQETNSVRIVRNHITSPLAPQPSRVSPLALAKDSLVSQGRQYQDGRQRGRANSPSQSPENIGIRNKRRKLDRKEDKRRKRNIKQENISPPPFHDIQPLGAAKPQATDNRPIIIDEPDLPHDARYAPTHRYADSPHRPSSRQVDVAPVNSPRVLSRAGMRQREEQDLRKVASMHNMRLEQSRDFVEYPQPRQRATSYVRVDSPMRELPREYASDSDPPMQEIRVVRTPAPEYREVYHGEPEVRYIPEPMPPPPRERIVVDQYGRRFREIIQERASVAPRAASSFVPRDTAGLQPQYYDNYEPIRAGSVRVDDRPHQSRYEQDMPPPTVARHLAEDAHPSSARESFDPSPRRAGSVAVFERPTRQMVYADNPADFQPPVRMSSVRPQPSRPEYEQQPAYQPMPRAASVRPAPPPSIREGSSFVDDGRFVRREYLPVEQQQPQTRYRVVEHDSQYQPQVQMQPRYVDAQGREVPPPLDDGGVRYVQRY